MRSFSLAMCAGVWLKRNMQFYMCVWFVDRPWRGRRGTASVWPGREPREYMQNFFEERRLRHGSRPLRRSRNALANGGEVTH